MFDTNLVVVGNVLAAPEWRRIQSSGALVANFRVASTARRYDRENSCWVDGNNLRIRVVAWRRLAEGVASSIRVGDPVIISGRLYTRDWKDDKGTNRLSYEMEAYTIGHDLSKGRARFFRLRAGAGPDTHEDAEHDAMLLGEPTVPIGPEESPVGYGDGLPDGDEPTFTEPIPSPGPLPEPQPGDDDELALEVERLVADQPPAGRRTRRSRREPVAA